MVAVATSSGNKGISTCCGSVDVQAGYVPDTREISGAELVMFCSDRAFSSKTSTTWSCATANSTCFGRL
jgi:hypothetical protein